MAHFAELDGSGNVLRVVVINNDDIKINGIESEVKGITLCKTLYGLGTNWVQTSYNGNMRKQYAGKNFKYDLIKDKFIAPQPYPSWTLNASDDWEAPVAYPGGGGSYKWDEAGQQWEPS